MSSFNKDLVGYIAARVALAGIQATADPEATVAVGNRTVGAGRLGSSLRGGALVPTQARVLCLCPSPPA